MDDFDVDVDNYPGRAVTVDDAFKHLGNDPDEHEALNRLSAMDSLEEKQTADENRILEETTDPTAIRDSLNTDPLSDDVANTTSFGYAAAAFTLIIGYLLSSA